MAGFWLDDPGLQERKKQLGKQRQRQERRIREKNKYVPVPEQEIVPLKTKDDLPPFGAPISDDESSYCDSFAGLPHAESEGEFFKGVASAAPQSPLPLEAPNIAPEGASVSNSPVLLSTTKAFADTNSK